MRIRAPKLFLALLVLVILAGGAFAATRVRMNPPASTGKQHGLDAEQVSAAQNTASFTALTQQAGGGEILGDAPFALMPPQSSPQAPDFTLTSLDGKTVTLSDAVKNGPVLLDFWATWCMPCRAEMPELGRVYAQYKARGFQVYGVNANDSVPGMKRFFRSGSPGYPMLADSSGVVATTYNVSAIPALFLIDKTGRVRSLLDGFDPNTLSDLPKSLDQLLAEQPQKTL